MSRTDVKAFREIVEPYLPAPSAAGVAKISISLPADLVDLLRASAADGGTSVSTLVAGALRRALAQAEQERLDAAIDEQNEENRSFADAYAATAAQLLAGIEW